VTARASPVKSSSNPVSHIHRQPPRWVKENPRVSTQRASFVSTAERTDGPTSISANAPSAQPGNPRLSREHPTERESSSRKSALRPNSPTRPSESVSVSSSSRMERSMHPFVVVVVGSVDSRVTSFVPNDGCLNFIDENDGTFFCGMRWKANG